MMNEAPMGEVIRVSWPEPPETVGIADAEVYYLYPEDATTEALAEVIPLERKARQGEQAVPAEHGLVFSHDANVQYITKELAPPSQENIDTLADVLTYMRDMYDYYAKQTWAFDNTGDRSNSHMAAVTTEARKDANTIAQKISLMEEPDDARLALDIVGKGGINSLYLKSALVRTYATRGIISDKEATAYWKGMLENATEGLTSQVHSDVAIYADQRWRDKTYGHNDIARRRLERTKEAFGSRAVSLSTTPPRGA